MWNDNKRPDLITLLPRIKGKAMACRYVVIYQTCYYADTQDSGQASKATQNKIDKYAELACTYIFYPLAIETVGTMHGTA